VSVSPTASADPATQDEVLASGCGLLDRSDHGRLALTGAQAKEFLNGQVSNEVEALEPGTGCAATFLTHKGKMLGDLRILDTGDELLLDTERVALQALFDLLRRTTIGHDAELHKRTLQTAQLSLVGPAARAVAGPAAQALPEDEHANVAAELAGVPVRLIVTDLGIDVLCASEAAETVGGALVAAGAVPVDEEAVEIVRVEHGRPRYGIDLDDSVMPEEAGLVERTVSFTKGCYVGQETVARLHWRGKPNRRLRGLRLSEAVPAGTVLRLGEKEVGTVTSPVHSPRHGDIALAIVRREALAEDGDEPVVLTAGDGDARATVVALPFA
jgi:folate-binding protein YgfZ